MPSLIRLDDPDVRCVGVVLLTAVLLIGALVLEHGFSLLPCALCLMQRIWVMVAGIVVAVSLAHDTRRRTYPVLAALAALIGAGFSLRQLWIMAFPDSAPACGADISYLIEVFPAADVLQAMTFGTGNCADHSVAIPLSALAGFVMIITWALWHLHRLVRA